ncbi:hypothetical protein EHS25_000375 [Saitozyma podzolica]|uniref:Uncharacterized protein n=1 Tax=Saitozyma podzolica TaxID=1890683 RepID=A0A427YVX0_9TREE|nr:hypothetical protein EHS25_000375 [Saitozyma podzolica]
MPKPAPIRTDHGPSCSHPILMPTGTHQVSKGSLRGAARARIMILTRDGARRGNINTFAPRPEPHLVGPRTVWRTLQVARGTFTLRDRSHLARYKAADGETSPLCIPSRSHSLASPRYRKTHRPHSLNPTLLRLRSLLLSDMRFINLLLPLSLLASVILAVPTEKTAGLVQRNVGGSVDVLSVVTTLKSSVVSPDSATLPHPNRYLCLVQYL